MMDWPEWKTYVQEVWPPDIVTLLYWAAVVAGATWLGYHWFDIGRDEETGEVNWAEIAWLAGYVICGGIFVVILMVVAGQSL